MGEWKYIFYVRSMMIRNGVIKAYNFSLFLNLDVSMVCGTVWVSLIILYPLLIPIACCILCNACYERNENQDRFTNDKKSKVMGSMSISECLPSYPSLSLTLTLTCYQLTVVGLGEG